MHRRLLLLFVLFLPAAAAQGVDVGTPAGDVYVSEDRACAGSTCIGDEPAPEPTEPEPTDPVGPDEGTPDDERAPADEAAPAEDPAPAQEPAESGWSSGVETRTAWALVAGTASAVLAAVAAQTGWLLRPLAWLGRGAVALFLFSRIQRDKLAKHPVRAQILDLVEAEPGIALQDIQRRIDVAWGTAVYHLNRLEKEKLLVSSHAGNRRMFFVANTPVAKLRQGFGLVQTGTSARIARTVLDRPGLDQKSVCQALAIANPTASKHLSRLEKHGLVESKKVSRQRFYEPTPALRQIVGAQPAGA